MQIVPIPWDHKATAVYSMPYEEKFFISTVKEGEAKLIDSNWTDNPRAFPANIKDIQVRKGFVRGSVEKLGMLLDKGSRSTETSLAKLTKE